MAAAAGLIRADPAPMVDELAALVDRESPSSDPIALGAAADTVAELGRAHLGVAPDRIEIDDRPHLRWSFGGETKVVLVGHLDTVWPLGTLAAWPFDVTDGVARGPGAFDMKAGLVQGFHALGALEDLRGVVYLVTSDEEIGSPTSRHLIEDVARPADAVLVLEPSLDGALKTARKGVSLYELAVTGREAHAGLEPERGVNALVELSKQIVELEALSRGDIGTTVTPTIAHAGTAANVVPASATAKVDVRVLSSEEQGRIDRAMRELEAFAPGATVEVRGGPNRPPMPPTASQQLYERACALAEELGIGALGAAHVGGGSDGNFTAAIGVPTLDGLGAVGGGAHARTEHVDVDTMRGRAGLVAALVADVLGS
jgi:glutamate carboxypeptidase